MPQPGYPHPVAQQPAADMQPLATAAGDSYTPLQEDGYPPPQGIPLPGYPPPVAQQPASNLQPQAPGDGWMEKPAPPPNCPPGLEYLTLIDQLLVQQKVELLEVLSGFETENKFTVKNSLGQKVFYAKEDSECCSRNCCGPLRPFGMKILDNFEREVIHLERPLACQGCCFPCCLQTMEVFSPPGSLVGSIEQEWSFWTPLFKIKNAAGDTVLRIQGPFCTFSICGDVEFKVLSEDGNVVVGKIYKQWSGLLRELLTDADFFGITFPGDLDVRMKAVMLGACFLIDMMFFEKPNN